MSTDDFYTYGAIPVTETYTGCGGEYCPGPYPRSMNFPDDPPPCPACSAGTKTTVRVYEPF